MADKAKQPSPDITSFEANVFGTLLEFHQKTMTLLRQSSLSDDQIDEVAKRIGEIYKGISAEIKRSQDLNVGQRLEPAYQEIKSLVDELSGKGEQTPSD